MKRALLLVLVVGLPACVTVDDMADHHCPTAGTTLTYNNFGRDFMGRYCVHCHGGAQSSAARSFSDLPTIRAARERIFANAAAYNTAMPPGPSDPSQKERDQLAEWLVCGAPE